MSRVRPQSPALEARDATCPSAAPLFAKIDGTESARSVAAHPAATGRPRPPVTRRLSRNAAHTRPVRGGCISPGPGRPRLYCSPRCRKAAQRLRERSGDLTEGVPA